MRFRWFGLLVVVCLFMISCSRTVTQLVTYGDQVAVTVTLRGTMEVNANRYFLVLGSNSNLSVPLPPPDNIDYEMIEPGTTPTLGSEEAYHTNYYSTWDGYIVLDPGGYFVAKGPFVAGQVPTRESVASVGEITSTLSFSFQLEEIYSTVPDHIYFDFVSVEWPTGQSKLPSDHLSSTNPYISKISGSISTIDDGEDTDVAGSLDIVSCRLEIQ